MSSPFTILCSSGSVSTWTDPSTLDLSGFRLSLSSQTPDRLTFQALAQSDATALFPYNSILQLRYNSTVIFAGRVQEPERVAAPNAEALQYTCIGPWSDLERCVYQQLWKRYDSGEEDFISDYRSRVILCQSDAGARLNSGAQISAALTYAIARGANLQIGTIDPAIEIPWEEALDITVAEVIQRMLRWSPDAVCWFDYSTTPPTFHCRLRSNLTTLSLPAFADVSGDAAALQIIACRDLQVPGVILRYEQENSVDDARVSVIVSDTAGTVTGLGTVISTIQLAGQTASTLSETLTTEDWPADLTDKTWWKSHIPRLQGKDNAKFSIATVTVKDTAGNTVDRATWKEILLTGTIQPWMSGKVSSKEVIVSGVLTETTNAHANDYGETEPYSAAPVVNQELKDISFKAIAIDDDTGSDNTKTYRATASYVSGEPIPTGVAAALYAAWSILHYRGAFTLEETEAGSRQYLGYKLNLTSGLAVWSTMAAIIQQADLDLDAARTTLTFGPPRQISPDDLVSLLSRFRSRRVATGWNLRSTGTPGTDVIQSGGVTSKNEPSEGASRPKKLLLQSHTAGAEDARITLDPTAVKTTSTYKVMQVQTVDGIPQTTFDYLRAHS